MAYAYSQDNLCMTAEHVLTLRGERTRFLGTERTGEISLGRQPNPQLDRFIRAHMDDEAVARAAATSSPELRGENRPADQSDHLPEVPPAPMS